MDKTSDLFCDTETTLCFSNNEKTDESTFVKPINTKDIKVIYYYDALCGWCYGFSKEMSKFNEEFKNRIEIDVVSGGLFLGERTGKINKVAPYIKAGAYKSVEARTGIKFGPGFLEDLLEIETIVLDSLLPAMALCIVKERFVEKTFEFADMLLRAVYFDGMNPIDVKAYKSYVEKIGFDFKEFSIKMKEEKYVEMAKDEFNLFKKMGHSGMPTVVLKKGNTEIPLSNGYTSFLELRESINKLIS